MSLWESLFAHLQQPVAQILLTRNDIADVRKPSNMDWVCDWLTEEQRTQYLNAQNTFSELFNMGVIPIVNENDTVAVSVRQSISHLTMSITERPRKFGKSTNSVTMTPSPPSPQLWCKQTISSS